MSQFVFLTIVGLLFIGAVALAKWWWRGERSVGRESFDIADD